MVTQERLDAVDDFWRLEAENANPLEKTYLNNGELRIKMSPNQDHTWLAGEIARLLGNHVVEDKLGYVFVECGCQLPSGRPALLLPDVSFESRARSAQPRLRTDAPYMPSAFPRPKRCVGYQR